MVVKDGLKGFRESMEQNHSWGAHIYWQHGLQSGAKKSSHISQCGIQAKSVQLVLPKSNPFQPIIRGIVHHSVAPRTHYHRCDINVDSNGDTLVNCHFHPRSCETHPNGKECCAKKSESGYRGLVSYLNGRGWEFYPTIRIIDEKGSPTNIQLKSRT